MLLILERFLKCYDELMNPVWANSAISQYYLEIQALDPAASAAASEQSIEQTETVLANLSVLPFVVFLIIFLLIGIAMLKKRQTFSHFVLALAVGFMVVSVPISVGLNSRGTSTPTKANLSTQPKNFVVKEVTSSGMVLEWETAEAVTGAVRYSTKGDLSESLTVVESVSETNEHQVSLTGLTPGVLYYIKILSGNVWYDYRGRPIEVRTGVPN